MSEVQDQPCPAIGAVSICCGDGGNSCCFLSMFCMFPFALQNLRQRAVPRIFSGTLRSAALELCLFYSSPTKAQEVATSSIIQPCPFQPPKPLCLKMTPLSWLSRQSTQF